MHQPHQEHITGGGTVTLAGSLPAPPSPPHLTGYKRGNPWRRNIPFLLLFHCETEQPPPICCRSSLTSPDSFCSGNHRGLTVRWPLFLQLTTDSSSLLTTSHHRCLLLIGEHPSLRHSSSVASCPSPTRAPKELNREAHLCPLAGFPPSRCLPSPLRPPER
jgi:hypothetical protein